MSTRIGELIRRFADTGRRLGAAGTAKSLWRQAEVVLLTGRASVTRRRLDTPQDFLKAGRSAGRLAGGERGLDILSEGIRLHPSASSLVDGFLQVAVERGLVDRALTDIPSRDGLPACERLFAGAASWNTRVGLIEYCLRAGFSDLADEQIEQAIRSCDQRGVIWRLSDVLRGVGRDDDAARIYRALAEQPAQVAEAALLQGLALERLGKPEEAVDRLEVAYREYRSAPQIREHLLRLMLDLGQIERAVGLTGGKADDPAALQAFFRMLVPGPQQVKMVALCLERGDLTVVRSILKRGPDEAPCESDVLWDIAERLAGKGFDTEARGLWRLLADRPQDSVRNVHFGALAKLQAGDLEGALVSLEAGQHAFPGASDLGQLYAQLCASDMEYQRYAEFRNESLETRADVCAVIEELYRRAMDGGAIEAFLANYQEIRSLCSQEVCGRLGTYALERLQDVSLSGQRSAQLAFYGKYLDVDGAFVSALHEALKARIERDIAAGELAESEWRRLDILSRLTAPMVPLESERLNRVAPEFIEACNALARSPVELHEPIADMTADWIPWQYMFCTGVLESYGEAMAALERIALKTWPGLAQTAAHVANGHLDRPKGRRLRIGFIVHDSMPMMSGLLAGLDPARFETVFLRPGGEGRTRAARDWVVRADRVVEFSDHNSFAAIDTIAAEELDIIVSGPSMAAIFFPLMARLAHLQMVLLEPNWTDGLTTEDYYISWRPAEPDRPAAFYRSRVALLKRPPYYIERHAVADVSEGEKMEVRRRLLGTYADHRLYLCANTPPKIHPDMDDTLRALLERDPDAVLVLLREDYAPAKTLKARLRRELGGLMDRVVFLSTLKQEEAHRLLLSADVCLDSFPLCGMSSSFDAMMLGVPIVTLPTMVPFGRWTAAIYDYIGVSGLTATSRDEYLEIAIRLAKDPVWRREIGAELRQKAEIFIESAASRAEFAAFIEQAWERHLAGQPPADWIDDRWQDDAASETWTRGVARIG